RTIFLYNERNLYSPFNTCIDCTLRVLVVVSNPFAECCHTTRWLWIDLYGFENFISSTIWSTLNTTSSLTSHFLFTPFTFGSNASAFHTFHGNWSDKFFLVCSFFNCRYLCF